MTTKDQIQKRREEIIWKDDSNLVYHSWSGSDYNPKQFNGGVASFQNLSLDQLTQLIEEDLIDIHDSQNQAPTVQEFYEFMQKYPFVTAHGYIVEARRSDHRVSIEGIEAKDFAETVNVGIGVFQRDFANMCRYADSFKMEEDKYRAWWD